MFEFFLGFGAGVFAAYTFPAIAGMVVEKVKAFFKQ